MKRIGRWIVAFLIVLGIGYNFILPFTPVWLDVVAWSAIGLAFIVAVLVNRKARNDTTEQNRPV
jgi:xanthine/uracil permease